MNSPIATLVRRYFSAYETQDRQVLEDLLDERFTFSSPLDDRINRAAYFARCWPNSRTLRRFTVEKIFADGDEAFIRYEAESSTGKNSATLNGSAFRAASSSRCRCISAATHGPPHQSPQFFPPRGWPTGRPPPHCFHARHAHLAPCQPTRKGDSHASSVLPLF